MIWSVCKRCRKIFTSLEDGLCRQSSVEVYDLGCEGRFEPWWGLLLSVSVFMLLALFENDFVLAGLSDNFLFFDSVFISGSTAFLIWIISSNEKSFLWVFSDISPFTISSRFTTCAGISLLTSDLKASILLKPQISSRFWLITIGCKRPISLMFSASEAISPRSFLNLLPIFILSIGIWDEELSFELVVKSLRSYS